MATLAPTISHSLAARNGGEAGMEAEHCSMPSMATMPEMDGTSSMSSMVSMPGMDATSATPSTPSTHNQASEDTGSKPPQHSATSDGDACGYCSLLAHMPAVPSVEALFSVTVRALQHTVATRFESVRRVEPLTFAQPRAPPFAS